MLYPIPCLKKSVVGLLLALTAVSPTLAQLPAFPGAQGFGRFATGGRNGTVYHVTNLNDSGPGSFRDAVSVSGRTVVFDVAGVIAYTGARYNVAPNITIAGQTAPGDGVTLYGDGIGYTGSHNTITRFIRYRMGVNGTKDKDAVSIDSGHDMIFDHITASWGRDETFSISGSDPVNITIQSSIISQGLQGHSAGGLVQTDGAVSILRSLYIDNDTRNPKVKGVNEYVNNVVCNWETIGYNMGGDSAGESFVNVFNNYFMRGPASGSSAISGGNTDFHIYATNNWYDGNRNGLLDGTELPFASYGPMDLKTTPYAYPIAPVSAYSPLTALKLAISDVGPSFRRDSVDELMIQQLTSWGLLGGTITSELIAPMNGPGVIRNGTPYPDADNDGMPDFWENGTGSNPAVANNNAASPSGSGYTRLEDYLNWLAEPHGIALQNTNVLVDLRQFTRGWVVVNHSPFWAVSNPTNGTVVLTNGYMALFTPTPGLNGPASFAFTVNDTDGSPVTRTMNLFFTPSAQSYTPVWHGDDLTNNWNATGDFNWHDGVSLLYQFQNGSPVRFDDTGSTNPAVNLIGSLTPASVAVNATKNFVLNGPGSLNGSMTLSKTNTGTLTINTTNNFTGATTVSNGTLLVHGALNSSAVTVRASGTIGGNGRLGSSVTVQSGGQTAPGNGIGGPGTLTISNSLTIANNVTHRFDISDDPNGTSKTNDLINIVGTLNVTGTNFIRVNLLDGPLADGTYPLFKYTTLSGSLANFVLINANGALTNPPGMIAIHVDNARTPAGLKWVGNGVNNNWDNGTTTNWLNGVTPDVFYFFDSPRFDDSGSSAPAVNLIGSLTPQSVTFDAAHNYTVSGSGSISGYGPLIKTNTGTLTITAVNDYAGATTLGGGVLSIAQLANAGIASPIGAPDGNADNLLFAGGTLRYTGSNTSTDRGATFDANANLEITGAGTTLTWNGGFVGPGALQKSGAGKLTLTANNTFTGGTVLSNGTLALSGPSGGATITANNYALGSGPVTLYSGTLILFGGGLGDAGAGYGTFGRPIEIPTNATVTMLTPARYTMSSRLTGDGTLNMEVNYVRGTLSGNWSEFNGTINLTAAAQDPGNGIGEFRVANNFGYAGATLFLNNGARITQSGSATNMEIGALGGVAGGIVGPGNDTSSGRSFRIGWNNQNATFAGQILADGANTVTKVGTGNWTLTGANTYNGGTIVNGGTLTVNNTSGSGTGSGAVTVNTGATLAGTGIISGATTINSGATNSPGNNAIGTLTVNNSVTLAAGSTTRIEINASSATKDLLDASGAFTYGGTLVVTNVSGTLVNGQSFKIFDGGSYGGSFATLSLPSLSPDLQWNTTALNTSGTISVISTNAVLPQSLNWVGDGAANVWNTTVSNWVNASSQPRAFANGDTVTFTNSGSVTPAVNLTISAAPAIMVVNSSQNFTLTGTGALTGSMGLNKSGPGRLTLANTGANTFSGGTTISGGSLQVGDGASVNGNLPGNIINNATLIFANPTAATSASLLTGSGTLVKQAAGTLTVTSTNSGYGGNVIIGGGAITLGTGAALNTGSLTLSNGGTFNFPPSSPAYFYPGSITVSSSQTGTVHSPALGNGVNGNLISGNSSSVLNISSGVSFGASTTAQFDSFTGTINVLAGGTLRFSPNSSGNTYGSLNPTFAVNGTLQPRNAGNTVRLGKISGTGTLSGTQTTNTGTASTIYQIGGANVNSTFNGTIASNTVSFGSLVVLHKVGTGKLTLTGNSTYTGGTIVSNGAVFVSNTTGSGTGAGTVAVRSGATLGGNGIISGATTIENGATLAPGDSIGKLTFNSSLTLASGSTSRLELNAAALTNDTVKTVGAIAYSGTLVVSNTSGTLTVGQSFKLFEAPGYSGSFSLTTLPTLGANLAWTNRLATDGTIAVFSTAPATPPVFNSVAAVGSNLVMSGTNGPANSAYYVLSATNVTLPVANWPRIATNNFNGSGNFAFTNAIGPGIPQQFYRLQLP
jgi:autotransporter-associated beta strand protein